MHDLSPDLTCISNPENETNTQFMTKIPLQACGTAYIDYLDDNTLLLVLMSNRCGLSISEKRIHVFQAKDIGIEV